MANSAIPVDAYMQDEMPNQLIMSNHDQMEREGYRSQVSNQQAQVIANLSDDGI